jgi:hypothetical protein
LIVDRSLDLTINPPYICTTSTLKASQVSMYQMALRYTRIIVGFFEIFP